MASRNQDSVDFPLPSLLPSELQLAMQVFNNMVIHVIWTQGQQSSRNAVMVRYAFYVSRERAAFLCRFFERAYTGHLGSARQGLAQFQGFTSDSPPQMREDVERTVLLFADFFDVRFLGPMMARGGRTQVHTTIADELAVQPYPAIRNATGTRSRSHECRLQCLACDASPGMAIAAWSRDCSTSQPAAQELCSTAIFRQSTTMAIC